LALALALVRDLRELLRRRARRRSSPCRPTCWLGSCWRGIALDLLQGRRRGLGTEPAGPSGPYVVWLWGLACPVPAPDSGGEPSQFRQTSLCTEMRRGMSRRPGLNAPTTRIPTRWAVTPTSARDPPCPRLTRRGTALSRRGWQAGRRRARCQRCPGRRRCSRSGPVLEVDEAVREDFLEGLHELVGERVQFFRPGADAIFLAAGTRRRPAGYRGVRVHARRLARSASPDGHVPSPVRGPFSAPSRRRG
jgi:hypothetical protein